VINLFWLDNFNIIVLHKIYNVLIKLKVDLIHVIACTYMYVTIENKWLPDNISNESPLKPYISWSKIIHIHLGLRWFSSLRDGYICIFPYKNRISQSPQWRPSWISDWQQHKFDNKIIRLFKIQPITWHQLDLTADFFSS